MLKYALVFAIGFILGNLWFGFMEWVAKKFKIVIRIGEEDEK